MEQPHSPVARETEKGNSSTHTSFMISDILDSTPRNRSCSVEESIASEDLSRGSPESGEEPDSQAEQREGSPSSDTETEKSSTAQGLLALRCTFTYITVYRCIAMI